MVLRVLRPVQGLVAADSESQHPALPQPPVDRDLSQQVIHILSAHAEPQHFSSPQVLLFGYNFQFRTFLSIDGSRLSEGPV